MNVIDYIDSNYSAPSDRVTIEFVGGVFFEFRRESNYADTKKLLAEAREFAESIYKGLDNDGSPIYACPKDKVDVMVSDADVIAQCRIFERQCTRAWRVDAATKEEAETETLTVWDFLKLASRHGNLFAGLIREYNNAQSLAVLEGEAKRLKAARKK